MIAAFTRAKGRQGKLYALVSPEGPPERCGPMPIQIISIVYLEIVVGCAILLCNYTMGPAMRRELGNAPAAIALGLPLLGFLLPTLWLLHIAMFLVVPMLARRSAGRVAPLYLLALMMLPGMSDLLMLGSTMLWQHDIHVTLGLGALVALLSSPDRARGRLPYDLPFACVFAVMVFIAVRDTSFTNLLRELMQTGLHYALPYYIVSRSIRSVADIKRIMMALAIAGAVLSAILLFEAIRTWPIYRQLYDHYGLPLDDIGVKFRAGAMRAGGPFLESTSMAFVLIFCFMAAYLSRDIFRTKQSHWLFTAVIGIGLIVPQSRGAWIALVIGLVLSDLFRRRYAPLSRKLAIIAAAGALLIPATIAGGRVAELIGLSGDATETVDYREQLWEAGKIELAKHPLVGQSQRQLLVSMAELRQGEGIIDFVNTYLFVALTSGIPGAILFTGAIAWASLSLWRNRGRTPSDAAAWVFVGVTVPLEMLAFTSFGGRAAITVFTFIAMAAALSSREVKKARPKPGPNRKRPPRLSADQVPSVVN